MCNPKLTCFINIMSQMLQESFLYRFLKTKHLIQTCDNQSLIASRGHFMFPSISSFHICVPFLFWPYFYHFIVWHQKKTNKQQVTGKSRRKSPRKFLSFHPGWSPEIPFANLTTCLLEVFGAANVLHYHPVGTRMFVPSMGRTEYVPTWIPYKSTSHVGKYTIVPWMVGGC